LVKGRVHVALVCTGAVCAPAWIARSTKTAAKTTDRWSAFMSPQVVGRKVNNANRA
jgi:hypothetical protein